MTIITDDNYGLFVDPLVGGQKVGRGLIYRDFEAVPRGALPGAAHPDTIRSLSWAEIKELWEEQVSQKSTIEDVMIHAGVKIKHQQQIPYCWEFATTLGAEAARALLGEKHVPLSPASNGCLVTGFVARGGYGREAIQGALKFGYVPSEFWPDTAIDRRYKNADTDKYRELYKASAYTELNQNDLQQMATCIVLRKPVSLGLDWWGHQILAVGLKFNNGVATPDFKIWNSWGTQWGDQGTGYLSPNRARGDGVAITCAVAA